jgi:hypothetical protein
VLLFLFCCGAPSILFCCKMDLFFLCLFDLFNHNLLDN